MHQIIHMTVTPSGTTLGPNLFDITGLDVNTNQSGTGLNITPSSNAFPPLQSGSITIGTPSAN